MLYAIIEVLNKKAESFDQRNQKDIILFFVNLGVFVFHLLLLQFFQGCALAMRELMLQ